MRFRLYFGWLLAAALAWLPGCAATVAGTLPVAVEERILSADFNQPSAVAAETAGQIYVLDGARNRVVRLSADGKLAAAFGEGLNRPLDLALTERGLLVADTGSGRLVLLGPDGRPARAYPLPADPKAGPAEPVSVAVLEGDAYWADRKAHRVCRTRLDTGETPNCFGGRGEGDGQFQYPYQIAVDRDGYLHVLDIANARVQVFNKDGRYFSQISRFGLSPGELFRPNGLTLDAANDTLFVADSYFGTISVFRKGEFRGLLRRADGQPVSLDSPTGLHFRDGRLYAAETGANRLRRWRVEYREDPAKAVENGKRVEISQKNCVLCHVSWASEAPAAVRAPDAAGALPEASFRMCYSCHNGAVMDSRLAIRHGAQHPTVYESPAERRRHAAAGPRRDKLPKEFPATRDKQLPCTSCHTPHGDAEHPDTLYKDHGNAWLRVPNRGGDLCERCHESKGKDARAGSPAAGSRAGAAGTKAHAAPAGHGLPGADLGSVVSGPNAEGSRAAHGRPGLSPASPVPEAPPVAFPSGRSSGEGNQEQVSASNAATRPGPAKILSKDWSGHGPNHPLGIRFAPPPRPGAEGFPTNPELHKGLPAALSSGGAALGHEGELICQTCHQVHGGHGDGVLTVLERDRGKLCSECHPRQFSKDDKDAHARGLHPVNLRRKSDKDGARPVLWKGKPEIEEVGCETCHHVHQGSAGTPLLPEGVASADALCRNCHERQHSGGEKEAHRKGVHPVGIRRKAEKPGDETELWHGRPEIGEVTCQACHRVHSGSPSTTLMPEGVSSDGALCRNCHGRQHTDSAEDARRKGVHPVNVGRKDEATGRPLEIWKGKPEIREVTCATCHKVHSGSGETALLPEGIRSAEALCENCHQRQHAEDKDDALRKGVHPVNVKLEEPVEIGGKKVDEVGCLTCHAVHKGKPDTAALVEADRDGELCGHCHEHKRTVVGTDHDLRLTAKDKANVHGDLPAESGVCGACHSLHRGTGERPFLAAAKTVAPKFAADPAERRDESPLKRDALCLNCHQPGGVGDKKDVRHFSHPVEDLVLRSDPKRMPILGKDEKPADFGRIACVTCHEPHLWDAGHKTPANRAGTVLAGNRENLEGTSRDSFLRQPGVAGTFCVDCHGAEGLVKFKYFHDKGRARNRGLPYLAR